MPLSPTYSYTRYLAAKKILDDRALNLRVYGSLAQAVNHLPGGAPLKVLEIGGGIGTMVERLMDWGLLTDAIYTTVDRHPDHVKEARARLQRYALDRGFQVASGEQAELIISHPPHCLRLSFESVDFFDFAPRVQGQAAWDLLIAHAFLDLVDLSAALPLLLSLLRPGGLFYFTLNFDGATIFEPPLDPDLDRQIATLYHRAMDERRGPGRPSGHSQTGRRLLNSIPPAGGRVLCAGSSDWVVFPGPKGYSEDEAYFLHFIIETIRQALEDHPHLEKERFSDWLAQRHAQVDQGRLIFIAHQLDLLGKVPLTV
jgi:SAM-dependent methyltransferase